MSAPTASGSATVVFTTASQSEESPARLPHAKHRVRASEPELRVGAFRKGDRFVIATGPRAVCAADIDPDWTGGDYGTPPVSGVDGDPVAEVAPTALHARTYLLAELANIDMDATTPAELLRLIDLTRKRLGRRRWRRMRADARARELAVTVNAPYVK